MTDHSLHIVADAHIWGVQEAFANLPGYKVKLDALESGEITPETVNRADVLLTRSATQVNAGLLKGSNVRFAATATIGDDHYDKLWLDSQGIIWATAAGSSTDSVIEYMLAVLLELHRRGLIELNQVRMGIIGAGRIGGKLAMLCQEMGLQVLLNDPPRQRNEAGELFLPLYDLLHKSDILSLHTPFIADGDDCTYHVLNADSLSEFQGRGIINAARGSCLDNDALLAWLEADDRRWAVLDCWEHEPDISMALLQHRQVVIATPHIAGHSLDGKAANTQYIYNALCDYLKVPGQWRMEQILPKVTSENIEVASLYQAIHELYPIQDDDVQLRTACAFKDQRRHYPVRRAWQHYRIHVDQSWVIQNELSQVMHMLKQHVLKK